MGTRSEGVGREGRKLSRLMVKKLTFAISARRSTRATVRSAASVSSGVVVGLGLGTGVGEGERWSELVRKGIADSTVVTARARPSSCSIPRIFPLATALRDVKR